MKRGGTIIPGEEFSFHGYNSLDDMLEDIATSPTQKQATQDEAVAIFKDKGTDWDSYIDIEYQKSLHKKLNDTMVSAGRVTTRVDKTVLKAIEEEVGIIPEEKLVSEVNAQREAYRMAEEATPLAKVGGLSFSRPFF